MAFLFVYWELFCLASSCVRLTSKRFCCSWTWTSIAPVKLSVFLRPFKLLCWRLGDFYSPTSLCSVTLSVWLIEQVFSSASELGGNRPVENNQPNKYHWLKYLQRPGLLRSLVLTLSQRKQKLKLGCPLWLQVNLSHLFGGREQPIRDTILLENEKHLIGDDTVFLWWVQTCQFSKEILFFSDGPLTAEKQWRQADCKQV